MTAWLTFSKFSIKLPPTAHFLTLLNPLTYFMSYYWSWGFWAGLILQSDIELL